MFNFNNKVVLITGSTRGIGWTTAKHFAEFGATVLINGANNKKNLDSCVKKLKDNYNINSTGYLFDVSDYEAVKNAYKQIYADYKKLDVLVNNAGVLYGSLIGMLEQEKINRMLDINLKGSIYNLQFASRLMSRNKSGSIINIGSIIGLKGSLGQSAYSSSKAGLIGLTNSAAKELAPNNIRVNALAPGMINTEMAKEGMNSEKIDQRISEIGLGRFGEPEEVAQVICFLASSLASYITGQTIGVDGSWQV